MKSLTTEDVFSYPSILCEICRKAQPYIPEHTVTPFPSGITVTVCRYLFVTRKSVESRCQIRCKWSTHFLTQAHTKYWEQQGVNVSVEGSLVDSYIDDYISIVC